MLHMGATLLWSAWHWLVIALSFNLTAKIGLLATGFAALIAFRAFQTSASDSANAHMHSLFRDYLRLRYDYDDGASAEHADAWGRHAQMTSFKLYVLEEMYAWVERERRKVRSLIFPPWGNRNRIDRKDALDGWEATILSHISGDWEGVVENISQNARCYGLVFLELLARHPEADDDFKTWVQSQRANLDKRRDRFHGVSELMTQEPACATS